MNGFDINNRNPKDIQKYAEGFLNRRMYALYYDVERCMDSYDINEYSMPFNLGTSVYGKIAKVYFPALMYCFSTINLLGALYCGLAGKQSYDTEKSFLYMKNFMKQKNPKGNPRYHDDKISLLINGYRHKIAHLAMPQTVMKYNNKVITWKLSDEDFDIPQHMELIDNKNNQRKLDIPSTTDPHELIVGQLDFDQTLVIHIKTFRDDIIDSVINKGYMSKIKDGNPEYTRFKNAINEIYGLEPITKIVPTHINC